MPPKYLALGRIVKARGLRGEVKVRLYADSLAMTVGATPLYLQDSKGTLTEYVVEQMRQAGSAWIVQLKGVQTLEQAEALVDHELLIPRSTAPALPEGTYYHADLIGLKVLTDEGQDLGRVVEILETGANDVYVVRRGDSEWLLPATREVVKRIDLAGEMMLVHLLEGMIETEAV